LHVKFLLERLQLAADRRLRDVERVGGRSDRAVLHDGSKVTQGCLDHLQVAICLISPPPGI
jgi:hypothetical protein